MPSRAGVHPGGVLNHRRVLEDPLRTPAEPPASDERAEAGEIERRQGPRIDVTLPVRFSSDRTERVRATMHSLAPEGAFLEAPEPVPIGEVIELIAPLPGPPASSGPARECFTTGAAEQRPRRWVSGFASSSRRSEPRSGSRASFEGYPGRVPREEQGLIAWPVQSVKPEVQWHAVTSCDLGPAVRRAGQADPVEPRPMARLQEVIAGARLTPGGDPCHRVSFRYLERSLAPAKGMRPRWLSDIAAIRVALAAQMWSLETLELARWNLAELNIEHMDAFEQAAHQIGDARSALGVEPPAEQAGVPGVDLDSAWDELLAGLHAVAGFLDRLCFNMDELRTLAG